MAKYINTTKFRIVVSTKQGLVNFNPGDTLVTESFIPTLDSYLVEDIPQKTKLNLIESSNEQKPTTENPTKKVYKVDISDIEEDQKFDLPDDYIVVVSDSLVEELKKEKASVRKPRRRRNK